MAIAVVAISLLTSWAGTQYAWSSPQILGLAAVATMSALGFIWVETKARDPIIPIQLFSNPSFSIPTVLGVLGALGMFAAVSYMPTYLQMVYAVSATTSGYFILPMVAGIMATSALSGAIITRTSHYRLFPVAGMAVIGAALFLLSTATPETGIWFVALYLGLLGMGLGCILQVLVLIVQDAVPVAEVGTATSANNFFREIGATVGIALVGSLFTSRLLTGLEGIDLGAVDQISTVEELTPALVAALPQAQQAAVVDAYASALTPLFGHVAPIFLGAVLVALLMPSKPRRESDRMELTSTRS